MRKWYCLYDMFVAALISALWVFVMCSSFDFFLYFAEGTRLLSLIEYTDFHTFITHIFLTADQDVLNCSWLMTVSHCSRSGKPVLLWLLLLFWALKFLLLLTPSACMYESGTYGNSFLSQQVKYMGPYSCYFTYYLYMGSVSVLQSSRSPSWNGAEVPE